MTARAMLLAGVLLAPWPAAAAQSTDSQATFRSGVQLVRFDVRVVDDSGRPITDIRPEEIEIVEGGRRLPVVLFQRVVEPAEDFGEAALRAVTAEVSSNEAFPRGHLYILVFDQQHITPGNEQRARMAAERFIRARVRPFDRVALYAIPGPGPQLHFTADRARVIKELANIRGQQERVVSSALGQMSVYEAHRVVQGDEKLTSDLIARMSAESGADVAGGAAEFAGGGGAGLGADAGIAPRLLRENARTIVNQTDGESRQFLQRLADVIAAFADIEGRKTVVLFSEGFFQDNLSRELEAVAASAARSYAVFYTMDLNPRAATALGSETVSETVPASETQARIAPMATLAVETDGMMVVDAGQRVGEALDAIAAQAGDYYIVGFAPSEEALANRGRYRRVSIAVRRPGARVSARTGYSVAPETAVADRKRAIDTVLGAPFVQQGLRIDYTTYVIQAPGTGQQRVVLSLDADLPVRREPGETADVVFVVRDVRDGRVAASGTDTIALPAAPRAGAAMGTAGWRVQFDVPAGSYLMRAVVREPGGLVGSADRRLEIVRLGGPEITLSDLVLGSAIAGLPVKPRAYTDDGLTGVIEAYARTRGQLEGMDVKLELSRLEDGQTVATFYAEMQPVTEIADGLGRRATFLLPLGDIPPGEYLARAMVNAAGEVIGERTRQVEVLAGRAPAAAAEEMTAVVAETVPAFEILRGDVARRYVDALRQRAQGTPLLPAARRASSGRWEEVEADLARAGGHDPAVAHALRGLAFFSREAFADAAAALKQALAADPGNALTAFFLGWAHEGAGDAAAALGAWRSAAHLDPSLVPAHLALADGYLRLAEPALALQAVRAGLTALPASPELREKLQQVERILR